MRAPNRWLLPAVFWTGLALFLAGQAVTSTFWATSLSFLGGALLIVVAIRALAALAGLHQEARPALLDDERLLFEADGVIVENRGPFFLARRDPYRARVTSQRILLGMKVFHVTINRDVTIASLLRNEPRSLRSVTISPGGARSAPDQNYTAAGLVSLEPAQRWGVRWRLRVPDVGPWREAIAAQRPDLLTSDT